jgi:signal transduction histidine kinase
MHDDLGSGLTTIRYLSEKALVNVKNTNDGEQITRIAEHSSRLVQNMSEIIWAMNARFDNAESLISYLRRFASELLDEHQIPLHFHISSEAPDHIPFSAEKRRNIFLVVKEALHNTIKYSGASKVDIEIVIGTNFQINIMEIDGIGFNPDDAGDKGNGIYNMRKRLEAIDGTIHFNHLPSGMQVSLSVPFNKLSNVEV